MSERAEVATMNDPGTLEYKCRRCGKVVRKAHVPDLQHSVNALLVCGSLRDLYPGGILVRLTDSHHCCEDGGIGIADFIGGTPDKKEGSGDGK